uniref:Mitogen-activated protein kinase kinase kinase N-terminal domain-containing protein n=1 Tax=Timema poppense TaxID=170557 RepID=A0A7R9DFN6_TIMPO|nr:unnamed protein product [Timema poppensis]
MNNHRFDTNPKDPDKPYHKEVSRLVTGKARCKLTRGMISFAQQWMIFVKERCERGRGLRPRWANHGLDFLNTVCEPENTQHLSDCDFEKLKTSIDECISHVIGTAVPASHSPPFHPHMSRSSVDQLYPRSRGSSPCNHARSKGFRTSKSVQDNTPTPPSLPQRSLSTQASENLTNGCLMDDRVDGIIAESLKVPVRGLTRTERVQAAIEQLENDLEDKLRSANLIGALSNVEAEDKVLIRPRGVTFSWQRGIKIATFSSDITNSIHTIKGNHIIQQPLSLATSPTPSIPSFNHNKALSPVTKPATHHPAATFSSNITNSIHTFIQPQQGSQPCNKTCHTSSSSHFL